MHEAKQEVKIHHLSLMHGERLDAYSLITR